MELTPAPNMGQLLRKYVDDHRIHQAAWARIQGVRKDTVRRYFKSTSMDTTTLWNICQVLKYNFFSDLAELVPAEFKTPVTASQKRIAELQEENKMLKMQVELLKEVVRK